MVWAARKVPGWPHYQIMSPNVSVSGIFPSTALGLGHVDADARAAEGPGVHHP